jgi:arylsulfatase A-like enzyme
LNVVLVILDTLRKDHVGAYGNSWIKTPNLDALANESLRFTRAYPESLPTICARRAIHTGMRTWPFWNWKPPKGDDVVLPGWQPVPEGQPTLAEILREEGYYNLFVTDTLHQFRASYNFHRGFHVHEWIRGQERDLFVPQSPAAREKVKGVLIGGPGAAHAEEIMRQYFANIEGRDREEDWFAPRVFMKGMKFLEATKDVAHSLPFFLVVDCYDPHQPWDPPEKYVRLYSDGYDGPEPIIPSIGPSDWLTEEQLERMRALYAGEVTMVDAWLGKFLNKMEDLDLREDTLLILLSDHGFAFGEHGIVGKLGSAMHPEVTDIIFMIRHPGGKGAGKTSDYFALTHDVAPTILGASGVEPPDQMEGQDLSVLLDVGQPEPRPYVTAGFADHAWARDEAWAMFARNDGSEAKLFNLTEDPNMNRDVAGDRPEVVSSMWNDYVLKDAGGSLPVTWPETDPRW